MAIIKVPRSAVIYFDHTVPWALLLFCLPLFLILSETLSRIPLKERMSQCLSEFDLFHFIYYPTTSTLFCKRYSILHYGWAILHYVSATFSLPASGPGPLIYCMAPYEAIQVSLVLVVAPSLISPGWHLHHPWLGMSSFRGTYSSVSSFVKHCPTCSATSDLDCHGLEFHCWVLSALYPRVCGLQMFTLWFVSGGEPLASLWSCLGCCIPGVCCLQDLSRSCLTCIWKVSS